MKRRTPKTTIPRRLELEYMLDQRRIMRQLKWYTVASLSKFREDQRIDSPGLQAFLQMSVPEILDEQKLRRRLRVLAMTLSEEKLRELRALLGRNVSAPAQGLINQWIDSQVEAIQVTVQEWLSASIATVVESRAAGTPIQEMVNAITTLSDQLSRRAEERASFRLLQLNSQIIEEVARGAGSTHYFWVTQNDSRVRDNHVRLHDTPQSWTSPPAGGGTRPSDPGHPGSGYGCRCVAEPVPAKRLQAIPRSQAVE